MGVETFVRTLDEAVAYSTIALVVVVATYVLQLAAVEYAVRHRVLPSGTPAGPMIPFTR